MKKQLSRLGIVFMLILRHPPVPEFAAFKKNDIVEDKSFSLRQVALQYHLN
jgi:hypothetical protein